MATLLLLCVAEVACGHRITETEQRQAMNQARLAASMWMEGELSQALREAHRAVELDPNCVDCQLTLAGIYGARNELPRAEEVLLALLADHPDNAYAANTLASVYINMGRPAEAEPYARRASEDESFSGRHLAFYHLGWSFLERDQYREALEAFGAALRESPQMCIAHYRVAQTYFEQRQYDAALEHLEVTVAEPAEESGPSPSAPPDQPRSCHEMPDAFHLLGLTLLALGHQEPAFAAFRRCVELAPERSAWSATCSRPLEEQENDGELDRSPSPE